MRNLYMSCCKQCLYVATSKTLIFVVSYSKESRTLSRLGPIKPIYKKRMSIIIFSVPPKQSIRPYKAP